MYGSERLRKEYTQVLGPKNEISWGVRALLHKYRRFGKYRRFEKSYVLGLSTYERNTHRSQDLKNKFLGVFVLYYINMGDSVNTGGLKRIMFQV